MLGLTSRSLCEHLVPWNTFHHITSKAFSFEKTRTRRLESKVKRPDRARRVWGTITHGIHTSFKPRIVTWQRKNNQSFTQVLCPKPVLDITLYFSLENLLSHPVLPSIKWHMPQWFVSLAHLDPKLFKMKKFLVTLLQSAWEHGTDLGCSLGNAVKSTINISSRVFLHLEVTPR